MAGQQRHYGTPNMHSRRERPPSISIPDDIDTNEMLSEILLVDSPSPQQQQQYHQQWGELSDLSPLAPLSPLANVSMSHSTDAKGNQGYHLPEGLNPTDIKMLMALSPANVAQHSHHGGPQGITPQLLSDITPSGSQVEIPPGWSLGFWDVANSGDTTQQAMATSANFLAQQEVGPSHPILMQAQAGQGGHGDPYGNVPAFQSLSPQANPKWGGLSPAAPGARGIFSFNPNDASDPSGVGLGSLGVSADLDFPISPMFAGSVSEEVPFNQVSGDQQQLFAAQQRQAAEQAAFQQQIQANHAAQAAAAVQAQQAQQAQHHAQRHGQHPGQHHGQHLGQHPSQAHHQNGYGDFGGSKPKANNRKRNRGATTPTTTSFGLNLGLSMPGGTPERTGHAGFAAGPPGPHGQHGPLGPSDFGMRSQMGGQGMPPLKPSAPPEPFQRPRAKNSGAKAKHLTESQENRIVDRVLESARTMAGPNGSDQPRTCNCKKSRCLKLYCECFAAGSFCLQRCRCNDCCNSPKYQALRAQAIRAALARNPEAFNDKFEGSNRSSVKAAQHRTGCRCKRSACLKKYCECFMADVVCGDNCKCTNCQNFAGSEQLRDRRQQIRQQELDTEAKRQRRAQQSGGGASAGGPGGYPLAGPPPDFAPQQRQRPQLAQHHLGMGAPHSMAQPPPRVKMSPHPGQGSEASARGGYSFMNLEGSSGAAAAAAAATAASWQNGMRLNGQHFPVGSINGGRVPMLSPPAMRQMGGAPREAAYGSASSSSEFAQMGPSHH